VALALLEAWQAEGCRPEPTLLVVGSIGEEAGGLPGATAFREWGDARGLRPDQLVVSEPTSCCPIYGHKGGVGFEVTVYGEAAHSSTPHLGRNAIVAASRAVLALDAEHERIQRMPVRTEVGNGSITVGLIAGGTGGNVVPDRCTFTGGRRTAPFEDPDEIAAELSAIIHAAMPPCTATLEPMACSAAFYQSPDSDLVRLLASSCGSEAATAPYGTNALRYVDWAREMVVFGPGSIDQAHKATEWVEIAELVRCAEGLEAWLRPA
jgi:acetylornithine deacetylase/succinyl-diaminopimelate desuccinylase-like protein